MRVDGSDTIKNEVEAYAGKLAPYLERLRSAASDASYELPESALYLPRDAQYQSEIRSAAERLGIGRTRYLFVVGIGGSNLACKALFDALFGPEANVDLHHPQVIWLDTVSERTLALVEALVSEEALVAEDIACVISSKSGTTTETIFNAEVVLAALYARFGDAARKRVLFACDDGSPLAETAAEKGAQSVGIPPSVGGRYSAFSSANLLAAWLAEIPVADALSGARKILETCLFEKDNPALVWSAAIDHAYREGKRVHDVFLFAPELESLGKWYRQLMAESLGKRYDRSRAEVRAGMLPTVSIGSTDLHSMAQLYFGGPQQSMASFVSISSREGMPMPSERTFPEVVPELAGKDSVEVSEAILGGTLAAYRDADMPYVHVSLDALSSEEIGAFMQCAIVSVMLLADLWGVNAFDQPEVEAYKSKTRALLGS